VKEWVWQKDTGFFENSTAKLVTGQIHKDGRERKGRGRYFGGSEESWSAGEFGGGVT